MATTNEQKKKKNEAPQATVAVATERKATAAKKESKTKVTVHFDCGFSNLLFIRGEGISGLSWEHGIQMKCTKPNEWVWETDKPFKQAQFKVLLNDTQYEDGENHSLSQGKASTIIPIF
jgi:hypothetical protein